MFKSILPYVEYHLNYEYIVAQLCEQKDEEVNTCNGQCHLAKKIKATSDNQASSEHQMIKLFDFFQQIKLLNLMLL